MTNPKTAGMSPKELIERADMSLTDLTASGGVGGGLLVPEQADMFLDIIYDEPTIFKAARQERMTSPTKKINRIGFNSRILKASPGENNALASSDRAKPNLSEITLTAQDYVGQVNIPYNVLTDSLERGNFETHLMTHIAKRVAIDLAEAALEGDTTSSDAFLAVQDGWLKMANQHTVDAAGATVSDQLMSQWYAAVPDKYLQNDNGWGMFMQRRIAIDWRSSVAGRMTIGGDRALSESGIPPFFGIPVMKDNTIHILPSGYTRGLFTHPLNLIVGIWKDITIETVRKIEERMLVVVIHLRAAYAVEQPDAAAVLTNVQPTV